jgi:hypothetical protein
MRVALFSEVYWPMVSGVGVTLLRLTKALQQRGHVVRVYTASYALPPACPSSCIPTYNGRSPVCGTS